jgi:hypothetical protein
MTGYQSKKAAAQGKLTVDREQLEQWLEALKDIDALHHSQESESVDAQKAIADMGQALAQPEQKPVPDEDELSNGLALALHDAVLIRIGKDDEATRQAITRIDKLVAKYTSDANPPAAQRPLVWLPDLTDADRKTYQAGHNAGVAHHKQATKREWVGLTDEEMQAVVDAQLLVSNINVYFKAIEAKLKEKNT